METLNQPISETFGRIVGYLIAWVAMTMALTLASRSIHLGPGFSNLLPYAIVAMAMGQIGRLLRKWLGN